MNEDKAARYHRLRRRTAVCAAAWSVLLLAGLLVSGGSHALRDLAARAAAHAPWPGALSYPLTVAIWALVVALIHELGTLPFAFFGGFVLDRRYELSRQTAREWLRDHLKALGLGLLLGVAAAVGIYVAMACWPVGWWVAAWIGALAAGVAMTWAAPVFLLPLFFTLKPLGQETLKRRLLALAARMGAPAIGIFEWRLSDRTSRANALLTGMGSTRRILLSDTLVVDYDEDEIEVVLAHELAHHVRHDVWRGLALQGLVAAVAFWLADALLRAWAGPLGLSGPADVAGMPILLLTAMAVSFVTLPVANALSRMTERRADHVALETTRNSDAFARAMRRLGTRNLAEDAPSWLVRVFFYTHPPLGERLADAQAWAARQRAGRQKPTDAWV